MSRFAARNVSLLLMLAAFPLISAGTTGDASFLWWLGLLALVAGASIPPIMRYVPPKERRDEPADRPTDLGDSSRVC